MTESPEKQAVIKQEIAPTPKRDKKGRILPGNSGNPKGRPKGKTIKERVLEWLEKHPDDMRSFVKHFVKDNRELTWQMLEGRPPQDMNLGSNADLPFTINIMKDDGTKGESS